METDHRKGTVLSGTQKGDCAFSRKEFYIKDLLLCISEEKRISASWKDNFYLVEL